MSLPRPQGYLVMRRAGGLWGIANGAVEGLSRDGAGYRIAASGGAVAADEVLGVVDLRVYPAAPALRRFWPEEAAGMAVHAGEPLVVVDPRRLPAALRCKDAGEDETDE